MRRFDPAYCYEKSICNDRPEIHDVVPKQAVGKATQTTIFTGISAVYFKLSKHS